jgi:hypothetical protein
MRVAKPVCANPMVEVSPRRQPSTTGTGPAVPHAIQFEMCLRGVIDRVVQLDVADFTAAMTEAKNAQSDKAESLLSRLAEQAMRTAVEPERSRARARFELMMVAPPCTGRGVQGFDGRLRGYQRRRRH